MANNGEFNEIDKALEKRIRDAYDTLGPSSSMQDRILANLAAYQEKVRAQQGATQSGPDQAAQTDASVQECAPVAAAVGVAATATGASKAAVDAAGSKDARVVDQAGPELASFELPMKELTARAQFDADSALVELPIADDLVLKGASDESDAFSESPEGESFGVDFTWDEDGADAVHQVLKAAQSGEAESESGSDGAAGAAAAAGLLSFEDALRLEHMPVGFDEEDDEDDDDAEDPFGIGTITGAEVAAAAGAASAGTAEGPHASPEPVRRSSSPFKVILPIAAAVAALGIGVFALNSAGVQLPFVDSVSQMSSARSDGAANKEATDDAKSGSASASSARAGTGLTTYNANTTNQTETAAAMGGSSSSGRQSGSSNSRETATIIIDSGSGSGSSSSSASSASNLPQPVAQETVVEEPPQPERQQAPAPAPAETVTEYSSPEPVVESYQNVPVETNTTPAPANDGGGFAQQELIYDTSKSTWGRDYPNVTLDDGTLITIAAGQENGAKIWNSDEVGGLTTEVFNGTATGPGGSTSVVVYHSYADDNTYLVIFTHDSGFFLAYRR